MTHGHARPSSDAPTRSISSPAWARRARPGVLGAAGLALCLMVPASSASAASYQNTVGLGTVGTYSVLAGSEVTNTGPSVLSGDLGVSPETSITGFPPGVFGGARHTADAEAASAQAALTTAYLDAQGRTPTGPDLGQAIAGGTFLAGVYNASSALDVSGAVTLDGEGDPNAVFIFQVGASLTTASSTSIVLTGNAQACNVFWQIGASATLGTSTTFAGSVLAMESITVNDGTTVAGRALARGAAVTLINTVFTSPACVPTSTTTALTATPATTGGSTTLTATVTAVGAATPTGTVEFTAGGSPVGSAVVGPDGRATLTLPVGTTTPLDLVATYTGFGSYAPSTSPTVSLAVTPAVVVAAPPAPVAVDTAAVTADAAARAAAARAAALADSGPAHTGLMVTAGAVLVLGGLGLTRLAAAPRRRARHVGPRRATP